MSRPREWLAQMQWSSDGRCPSCRRAPPTHAEGCDYRATMDCAEGFLLDALEAVRATKGGDR